MIADIYEAALLHFEMIGNNPHWGCFILSYFRFFYSFCASFYYCKIIVQQNDFAPRRLGILKVGYFIEYLT